MNPKQKAIGRGGLALLAAGAVVGALVVLPGAAVATLAPGAPTAPGSITVSLVTANSATLTWAPSRDTLGVEGYQIFRQISGGTSTLIATTDGGVAHYVAQDLYAGKAYTFAVDAIDTAGQISPQTTASVNTAVEPNTTPPVAPTTVVLQPFSESRMDVLWNGSVTPNVSGYTILRDGSPIAQLDLPGGLHYSDNGLAAGSTHSYQVEAISDAGITSPATVAKSATTPASGTVQIARGPYLGNVSANSAVVSWWTNVPTSGTVQYGVGATNLSATDPTVQVKHQITLTGLTAGASYQYTVGNGTVTSTLATFKTAAAAGTAFSFAAIGDFGGASPGESQNAKNIGAAGTSFIQTLGDNIYPSAGLPDPSFPTTYSDYDARFFKQFGPVVNSQPFFPANGNQEYYSNGAFWSTFPMPGTNHSWYSYNWGNAHILVLDAEVAFTVGSPQYAFAQADLAANQAATWRIVVMQRPPYSSSSATSSSKTAQAALVPLFQQQHVALVLSGNSHNYERSYPLINGSPTVGGVTYIVSGGGGNGHNTFTTTPEPAWSAVRDSTRYEFAKVSVSATSLTVSAIDAATNTTFDTVTIGGPAAPATTLAYIASSRQGAAVYINGLIKEFSGGVRISAANRTVYLQRLIGGAWQTILARQTNASGQIAVGFIQSNVLTYRLYVAPTTGATAAYSGTTVR